VVAGGLGPDPNLWCYGHFVENTLSGQLGTHRTSLSLV
jgi:hypothetical protein